MKIMQKRKVKSKWGDTKIKTKFLWWPVTIKYNDEYRETRWLSTETVKWTFTGVFRGEPCWKAKQFIDRDE